jgi:hypothetical protein
MAWDTLEMASAIAPEDAVLTRARMDLMSAVSDYTLALSKGAEAVKSGHYSVGLAWYLSAQELNPASELCNREIRRVSGLVLEKIK